MQPSQGPLRHRCNTTVILKTIQATAEPCHRQQSAALSMMLSQEQQTTADGGLRKQSKTLTKGGERICFVIGVKLAFEQAFPRPAQQNPRLFLTHACYIHMLLHASAHTDCWPLTPSTRRSALHGEQQERIKILHLRARQATLMQQQMPLCNTLPG